MTGYSAFNQWNVDLRKTHVTLTKKQYEEWQKLYILEALKGNTNYGHTFCQHFDINNHILSLVLDNAEADTYIRKHYVAEIKHRRRITAS